MILPVMRGFAALALLALTACASHPSKPDALPPAAAGIDWNTARTVTVKMTDFDFTPAKISLESQQPVKLTLVNDGTDVHDFSAPAFFAASALRQGSTGPAGGKVSLAKGKSAEIDLVPGPAGTYPLTCTEFLHDMFGMTGSITVTAASH